jgi:tetratricopeptide (TPR) repeat protein
MKRSSQILITVFCALVVGVAGYFIASKRNPGPEIPSLSLRGGSANASTEFLNAQKAVEYYRDEIRKHPETVKNYLELAELFQQEARVTGRHHEYIPKARYLIDESLRLDPQNFDARMIKGTMLMTMHHFGEARELAEDAVKQNPHSAIGYGVLCDALLESGRYEEAVKACDQMLGIRPDLRSYARASYLRELHGDDAGAVEAMKLAADAGVFGQENRAWALYNLGKLFLNEGNLDTAAFIFKGILEERPDYAYALSGLAQVKRAKGETQEAVDLITKAYQQTPEHIFVEQLADIYRSTGQTQSADGVAKIVLQAFEQHEQDGWNINREYAMFCANHGIDLAGALERAKKEFGLRPDNIDVLETYAWTLYKNGRGAEAVPYIEKAMRLHTKSFTLHYHAGAIYAAAGMKDSADAYFARARSENRFVNVFCPDVNQQPKSSPGMAQLR